MTTTILTEKCGHHCVYTRIDSPPIERHCDCTECHGRDTETA